MINDKATWQRYRVWLRKARHNPGQCLLQQAFDMPCDRCDGTAPFLSYYPLSTVRQSSMMVEVLHLLKQKDATGRYLRIVEPAPFGGSASLDYFERTNKKTMNIPHSHLMVLANARYIYLAGMSEHGSRIWVGTENAYPQANLQRDPARQTA